MFTFPSTLFTGTPVAASPMWTLVSKQVGDGVSGTLTWSGLNGDVDKMYRLVGRVEPVVASTRISVRPNGSSSDLDGEYWIGGSSWSRVTTTDGTLIAFSSPGETPFFDMTIFADKSGGEQRRFGWLLWDKTPNPEPAIGAHAWEDSATLLTSLTMEAFGGFTTATAVWLYKLTNPAG